QTLPTPFCLLLYTNFHSLFPPYIIYIQLFCSTPFSSENQPCVVRKMEYYMDERCKLSKDDPCCHSYSSSNNKSSSLFRSFSQKSPNSNISSLPRSFSQKNPYKSSLSRSSSQKSSTSKCRLTKSASQRCANFRSKCSNLAKEQKSKFYIVKRCIGMLVRWKKHGDS
ncbi:hypothetical protein AABB24_032046, partial [Solanum stoloniferum]